jgi:hypothetical protein
MSTSRWLLPFTRGVDVRAIHQVARLAASCGATVYPVALISSPCDRPSRQVRREQRMEVNDFFEVVRWQTARYRVPVVCQQMFTHDVVQSIRLLAQEWLCTGVVVVVGHQKGILLETGDVKQLLLKPPVALVLLRRDEQQRRVRRTSLPGLGVFSGLHRFWMAWKKSERMRLVGEQEDGAHADKNERLSEKL